MGAFHLVCTECRHTYGRDEVDYTCPDCSAAQRPGECLRGVLRLEYDAPAEFPRESTGSAPGGKSARDQRRYLDLLPIDDPDLLPALPIGPTPLLASPRLREDLGLPRLFLKDETGLPTGSLKDRASSIVVAKACEKGHKVVTTASTGNAATALAGMCASVGLGCVVLVPADAPRAKLVQMLLYGARVLPLEGTYDDAFALSLEATRQLGWYNRSTAYNPYTVEGKKTVSFEIWEQLGRVVPDVVTVPVGDGVILAGVQKGFDDLRKAGLIDRTPRLMAVQAAGSAAIVQAWEQDAARKAEQGRAREAALRVMPLPQARTIADSIRVAAPANGTWALNALRATDGFAVTVTDEEILIAMSSLARLSGVFAEPAGAAATAGVARAVRDGRLASDQTVVALVTGTGLKDVNAAMQAVRMPERLPPTLEAVQEAVGRDCAPN